MLKDSLWRYGEQGRVVEIITGQLVFAYRGLYHDRYVVWLECDTVSRERPCARFRRIFICSPVDLIRITQLVFLLVSEARLICQKQVKCIAIDVFN